MCFMGKIQTMTKAEIAKSLLEDKTCENCSFLNQPPGVDLDQFPKPRCSNSIRHDRLPRYRTCENWKPNFSQYLANANIAFPIISRSMPNMIAQQIVSVQPMDASVGEIFHIKYKMSFKARIKHIFNTIRYRRRK